MLGGGLGSSSERESESVSGERKSMVLIIMVYVSLVN
jgi:hypothetical protein